MDILKYILFAIVGFISLYIIVIFLLWCFFFFIGFTIKYNKEYTKPSKFYNKIFVFWYKYICWQARVKIHSTGLENIPTNTRFMLVSNHRSKFDNFIHCVLLEKEQLAYISKVENFKIILARKYMKRGMYLPMNRGETKESLKTILKAIDYIKSGMLSIGVFPEGKRSKDGNLLEFKAGCFKIAEKSKCPIVVCCLQGTENIHKNFPWKRTHVYADFIKVYYQNDYENKTTVQISDEIYKLMYDKLNK